MERSFWERDRAERVTDLIIVGGGFAACHFARSIKEVAPSLSVRILEAGTHSLGASRKNAGNLCYGSPSEILDDIDRYGKGWALETVHMRWEGMQKVRGLVDEERVELQDLGGHEVFRSEEEKKFVDERIGELNEELRAIFGKAPFHPLSGEELARMGFRGMHGGVRILGEAGVDPFLLHEAMREKLDPLGVMYESGRKVLDLQEEADRILLHLEGEKDVLAARQVVVACNGYAQRLLPELGIVPARGQVLVTEPLSDLPFRGNFHMERGDLYFRNVGDRVLLGGGRALDKKTEQTDVAGLNPMIRETLDQILRDELLPGRHPQIAHRWSGIMGFTKNKRPILDFYRDRVGVVGGFSGMGVALTAEFGVKMAEKILEKRD